MTDYKEVYLASTQAYQDRNIDKMMDYASDNFSWYNIMPEGPKRLAESKEQAKFGMKMVFDNLDYLSGQVDFLETFGNILVAVETDTIREDGEEVKKRRMSIYECEDGKLHRCFSFAIEEDGQQSAAS